MVESVGSYDEISEETYFSSDEFALDEANRESKKEVVEEAPPRSSEEPSVPLSLALSVKEGIKAESMFMESTYVEKIASSGDDLPLDVKKALMESEEGVYKGFIGYLHAHPQATGNELGTELDGLRTTYRTQLNKAFDKIGWTPACKKASGLYDDYVNSIGSKINYSGPTDPSTIPNPSGGGTIPEDKAATEKAEQDIAKQLDDLEARIGSAQTDYKNAEKVFETAQSEVDSYQKDPHHDPDRLSAAEKDLTEAKNCLNDAKEKLQGFQNDPSFIDLKAQLANAEAALKKFDDPSITKADADKALDSANDADMKAGHDSAILSNTLDQIGRNIDSVNFYAEDIRSIISGGPISPFPPPSLWPSWWTAADQKQLEDLVKTNITDPEAKIKGYMDKGDYQGYAQAINALEACSDDIISELNALLRNLMQPHWTDPGAQDWNQKLGDSINKIQSDLETYLKPYVSEGNPIPTQYTDQYKSLNIDGMTMYKITDKEGNTWLWPAGGFGTGTSESMAYTMLNAVQRGDENLYKQLLKSYNHFANLSYQNGIEMDPSDYQGVFGLMGWQFNPVPSGKPIDPRSGQILIGSDAKGQEYFMVRDSASDADEDIIHSMILASQKWPDINSTSLYFGGKTYGLVYDFKDYITNTIHSFVTHDVNDDGMIDMGDSTHNKGLGFPDYVHPDALAAMMQYLYPDGKTDGNEEKTQDFNRLKLCLTSEMKALTKYANANNGWIYDSWPGKDGKYTKNFSGEAVRILWTFPAFLLFCQKNPQFVTNSGLNQKDPKTGVSIVDSATKIIKDLTLNVLRNFTEAGDPKSSHIDPNGPDQVTGSMGVGAQLYFDLLALRKLGVLSVDSKVEMEDPLTGGSSGVPAKTEEVPFNDALVRAKADYWYLMRDEFKDLSPKTYGNDYFLLQFGNMLHSLIENYNLDPQKQ